jgi:hypothetical protein
VKDPVRVVVARRASKRRHDARPEDVEQVVRVWSLLHGIVSLELGGTYASMEVDADELFATELESITERLARRGVGVPPGPDPAP